MNTKRTILGSIATLATSTLLVLGLPLTAQAATAQTLDPSLITAGKTSLTLNLTNIQYASTPTNGVSIRLLRNGGGDDCDPIQTYVPAPGSYCWSEEDADRSSTNPHDTFTFDNLITGIPYEIIVNVNEGTSSETFIGITHTTYSAPQAPEENPGVSISTNGLTAKVSIEAEYDPWNINDGSNINNLKYNLYAHYNNTWHKVGSKLKGTAVLNLTKLPLKTSIYFAETDINTIGESAKSPHSPTIKLVAAAPYINNFRGVIYPTHAALRWNKSAPGAGHITKYVVTVQTDTGKTIYKHAFNSKKRSATVNYLKRRHVYYFYLTVYNSYGSHTTSQELIGQSK